MQLNKFPLLGFHTFCSTSGEDVSAFLVCTLAVHRVNSDPVRFLLQGKLVRMSSLPMGTGLCLSIWQVILLFPLVTPFGYNCQVQHQENEPVAGVEYRPSY